MNQSQMFKGTFFTEEEIEILKELQAAKTVTKSANGMFLIGTLLISANIKTALVATGYIEEKLVGNEIVRTATIKALKAL